MVVTITALPGALTLESFVPEPALRLESGRALYVTKEALGVLVRVVGADGRLELSVVLTSDGPVLRMRALSLQLEAEEIGLHAKRIELDAGEALSLRTDGQLDEIVRGRRAAPCLAAQSRRLATIASSQPQGRFRCARPATFGSTARTSSSIASRHASQP
jgi:hypothetical protein